MEKINKMSVQEKLQKRIDSISEYVEKDGRSHLAVCSSAPSYGWDADEWHHKNAMMEAWRKRGYQVSSKTNHGVLDIYIVKPITLE